MVISFIISKTGDDEIVIVFIITIQVDGGIELKYHKINDHRRVIKK